MRTRVVGNTLTVRAISGLHVVSLAWDFTAAPDFAAGVPPQLAGLLGFAIERSELGAAGQVVERYMLRGIKRFAAVDEGLAPGTPVRLDSHPVQSFLWADYTAKPETSYAYRVIPVYGEPKNLDVRNADATSVRIATEAEQGIAGAGALRHDIYFNRGVIGSQAYARRYQNAAPDPDRPRSKEMRWLSRGLYEGLLKFIDCAADGFALRCAFYEFHYRPVARALRAALDRGADVQIVYDATSGYKAENEATLRGAGLQGPKIALPRTVSEGIRHNKFIVLLDGEQPIAVWTGSTNISHGGIFGHSNVGHVVWDRSIAEQYLAYWERLAKNLTPTKLRAPNREATPLPAGRPPVGVTALFSARDAANANDTLQWYADRMADASEIVCLTVAFNLDPAFQTVISRNNDVLRFIVKDDDLSQTERIGTDRDVLFAAGGRLEEGALANFLAERGNPLNRNDYIHTKFMLVDPLGNDPLVISGSANFSKPSQRVNDENMLVIRGDTRVADIYFGEFMRIFDHHYARYLVEKLQNEGRSDSSAGYLKTVAEDWLPAHFDARSPKSKRRRYFVG